MYIHNIQIKDPRNGIYNIDKEYLESQANICTILSKAAERTNVTSTLIEAGTNNNCQT